MVHPLLAALFRISVISLAGSVVELPCDGVPFVLVILEAASDREYTMIYSRRAASWGDHLGDLWVCLSREMLWYSKKV